MTCPHCNHPAADGRNYCGSCGNSLVQYCQRCGFRNPAADRYCGGCGRPLAADAAQPAAAPPEGAPAVPLAAPADAPLPGGMADLLEAARQTEAVASQDADVKVSQNDIDSLFGE